MKQWSAGVLAAIAFFLAGASALAGGRHGALVPWKVIPRGDTPKPAPLSLYWIPASRDELRRSELLTSDELTMFASQCVAMRVVRPDDGALIAKLAAEDLPVAILVDDAGAEVARVANERGMLRLHDIETMVRRALDARGSAADALLDDARSKLESGETDAAIALYQKVFDQRCMCPRQGKDAQRALKKLLRGR